MSDHSSISSMHLCDYCGQWHMYSEEMCRDINNRSVSTICPCSECEYRKNGVTESECRERERAAWNACYAELVKHKRVSFMGETAEWVAAEAARRYGEGRGK